MRYKTIALALTAAMVMGTAAGCAKKEEEPVMESIPESVAESEVTESVTEVTTETTKETTKATETETEETEESGVETSFEVGGYGDLIPGEIYFLNDPADGNSPIQGIALTGNVAGTGSFNTTNTNTNPVRCVFEMNEWVEIYLDCDAEEVQVWVFNYTGNLGGYESASYTGDSMVGVIAMAPLFNPGSEDFCWGSFCLNPEEVTPGYYDLVFTVDGKAYAMMVTRFYGEGELSGMSDKELTDLMGEI